MINVEAPERSFPEFWESTAFGRELERLQDEGRWDGYVYGLNERRTHVLVIGPEFVSVASVHTVNGLGRWECTRQHFDGCSGVYAERFPVRPF